MARTARDLALVARDIAARRRAVGHMRDPGRVPHPPR
jgi:hypothetical protein